MTASLLDIPTRAPKRVATYQDVIDAPPNMVAEIINGMLYTMPRPAPPHAETQSNLLGWAHSSFGSGKGGGTKKWRVVVEPELHLGEDVLVPDMAAWRRERMPKRPKAAYYALSPDWVCEVLSESTRKIDLGAKRDLYAFYRVAYLWMIDPIAHTLDAFSLEEGNWARIATIAGDAEVRLPPFDSVTIELSHIWDEDSEE